MQVLSFKDNDFAFDVRHDDGTITECNPWRELADIRTSAAAGITPETILRLAELGAACDAAAGRAVHDAKMADANYRSWAGGRHGELRKPQESDETYSSGPKKGQAKTVQLSVDDVKAGVESDPEFLALKRRIARADGQAASYKNMGRRITRALAALQGVVITGEDAGRALQYVAPSGPSPAPHVPAGHMAYADGEDW
jgi:hypothetical protein